MRDCFKTREEALEIAAERGYYQIAESTFEDEEGCIMKVVQSSKGGWYYDWLVY